MSAAPLATPDPQPERIRYAGLPASERARLLLADVQHLQEQLGSRNRTSPDGERLDGPDYWEWRRRAAHALRCRLAEYRDAKAAAQAERTQAPREPLAGGMHPRSAARLAHTLKQLFEDIEVRLEPVDCDRCVVRVVTGDFPDILIFAASVLDGEGVE